ncbi:hypothetical protein BLOT_010408 [Blomia tropicalis]|nr:hypothetical protein BLOT_010408 [Blomia tropicalis]
MDGRRERLKCESVVVLRWFSNNKNYKEFSTPIFTDVIIVILQCDRFAVCHSFVGVSVLNLLHIQKKTSTFQHSSLWFIFNININNNNNNIFDDNNT